MKYLRLFIILVILGLVMYELYKSIKSDAGKTENPAEEAGTEAEVQIQAE